MRMYVHLLVYVWIKPKPPQTTDQDRPFVNGVQEPPQLKIEIPANRYA